MSNLIQKTKSVGYVVLGFILLNPKIVGAQILVPIVPGSCMGGSDASEGPVNNQGCGWNELVQMGQNIIQDAVVLVALLSVVSIAYAGFLYATANGNDGQIKKAHQVFEKVVWGIFLTLGAWLIVYSIVDWIGVKNEFKK